MAVKILKRRIVTSSKASDQLRKEYLAADKLMEIPGRLIVETKFATMPDVMNGSKLEPDKDLDKKWLHSKIDDPRYHWCHLHMTNLEWKKAGIRSGLLGSSGVVNGKMITYGRWPTDSFVLADKFAEPVKSLTEVGRGSWHEGAHAANRLLASFIGIPYSQIRQLVHFYFYGWKRMYTEAEEEAGIAKRYEVIADPITMWQMLVWEILPDIGVADPVVPPPPPPVVPVPPTPSLYPLVQRTADQLVQIADLNGTPIRITSAYRSFAEQDELYAQGRTKPGVIVTNAKGGESFHNYRIAFDVVFRNEGYSGDFDKLARYAKVLGLEWGGDWPSFPDKPHFQITLGYPLSDFQKNKVDYSKFA